jgi:predicted nucleotidyltransferase
MARVLLRLPAELHRSLGSAAAAAGLSFNEYCVQRLRVPADSGVGPPVRALVFERARAQFGDDLVGIVALGSWARGEPAATSDIDVLIVIAEAIPLTRDLYSRWDRSPLVFEGRTVDVHFTHLPPAPGPVWCEAAVDGIVWYDSDGRLHGCLSDIRRAIADGRLVRAFAHGQPYWKGAA